MPMESTMLMVNQVTGGQMMVKIGISSKRVKNSQGVAKDSSGEHKFVNGKYAAATGNGSDGLSNVLSIAQSYLGVEMGSAEHKKIVDAYNSVNPKPVGYTAKYSDDWCDVFVTTVFQQAGLSSLIGRECGVQRHIGIMQQKGIWQGKVLPKAGDVLHLTGMVEDLPPHRNC